MASTVNEINAAAGRIGTSYRLSLDSRDSAIRVNGAPNRVATLTNYGPGTLRTATIDNAGAYGTFTDLVTGGTQAVTSPDRIFLVQSVDTATGIAVVIS